MTKKTDKKTVEVTSTMEVKPSFPTMSSFTIKATIPTGAYSNISPEMTFTDCSFDDVENTIMPKMEEMFAKYLGYNDRVIAQQKMAEEALRKTNTPASVVPTQPVAPTQAPVAQNNIPQPVQPALVNTTHEVSPSMANALKVVNESKTIPALNIIKKSVADSVKLTVDEQNELNMIIDTKIAELNK